MTRSTKGTVKLVVETVNHEFSKRKSFSAADLNRHLAIDSTKYLRLLGRLGFVEQAKEPAAEKTKIYTRTASWPPPAEFFRGTPIGIVYYIQKGFRFGLQDWGGEGRDTLYRCRAGILRVT